MKLPLIDGVTRPAWQRRDMAVLLLHEACPVCDAFRAALADPPAALRDPEVSVVPAPPPAAAKVARAAEVEEGRAAVVVGDRFLEIFAVLDVHAQPAEDLVEDLASWMDAVARQCGECSREGMEAPLTGG